MCIRDSYRTDKWGRDDRNIEFPVDYVAAATTYADVGTLFTTYDSLPSISYGSPFWVSGIPVTAVIDTTHTIKTLTGACTTSSITTGDYGDDSLETLFSRAKIRYLTAPTSAQMVNYYRQNLGDALTQDATTPQSNSRFDVLRSARWHRARFDFVGDWEATGFTPDVKIDGSE